MDDQAQQRLIQQLASFNNGGNATSSGASSAFAGQTTSAHHPNHQQPILHPTLAQKQIQQLPGFAQGHYNYSESNAASASESTSQTETATTPSSAMDSIANNPNIKAILQLAQRNAIKDLLGSFKMLFQVYEFV